MIDHWTVLFPMNGKVIGWKVFDKRLPAVREFSQFPEFTVTRGQQLEWKTFGRYAWVKAVVSTSDGTLEVEFKLCQSPLLS